MTSLTAEPTTSQEFFFELTRKQLTERLDRNFRATQIYEAVYQQWRDDFGSITSLPKTLRTALGRSLDIRLPEIHRSFDSDDGTKRYLMRLADGELAETVFIPDGDRNTICVSSQVGCALACTFCLTAQLGFVRHLTAGEIVAQVVMAQRANIDPAPDSRDHFNVVLMGMGEPLHNYENVMKALGILHDESGLGMSMSRITLSTAGLIPELDRLTREPLLPKLAISLTGATRAKRDQLMPINRTYSIPQLVSTLRRFPLKPRQRITLEYVLLAGVTDTDKEALALAGIALSIPAKVNLIPLNESPDLDFKRPSENSILRFQRILREKNVDAFVRKSRGTDISAACGQLKQNELTKEIDLEALKR
jgi:23S rRNA (adenine2503-C2)-methyltransferase